jgi:SAM-dependent methyltransferase
MSRLRPKAQAAVHASFLAVSLLLLRVLPDPSWKPSGSDDPVLRILALLAATVGLPYLLLSTTGPLLQAWYARTHHVAFPYRLYAVSNFGSLLALVTYPILVEPKMTTSAQAVVWSAGYVAFGVACAACAWWSLKPKPLPEPEPPGEPPAAPPEPPAWPDPPMEATAAAEPLPEAIAPAAPEQPGEPVAPPWHSYLLWTLLAACSSTLLLAVTNHVCQNIAPVPMLWILPLSLYLLSFILTFGRDNLYSPGVFLGFLALALSGMTYGLAKFDGATKLWLVVLLYTSGLLVCCLVCHGELARRRPHARYLTGFYLAISLGGALGGVFVGWLAPNIFPGYYEMPIGVFLCTLLGLIIFRGANRFTYAAWAFLTIVLGLSLYISERDLARESRLMVRNFYGALRVTQSGADADPFATRTLVHGTITHGLQYLSPMRSRMHTTYYGSESGVGLAIENTRRSPQRVGVIGLGTGTIASYGRTGDSYRFYDINPLVADIARSEFRYLAECPAKVEVVLGDARLSLEREPPQNFDVLAVDAFSSDSIPVHLLTIEAFRVYFRHVKPDGILAVHVSNRHLELEPIVELAARSLGKTTRLVDTDDGSDLVYGATWVLVASDPAVFEQEAFGRHKSKITVKPGVRMWTDDYSNLWQILH